MDDVRRTQVKEIVSLLDKEDLKYAEDALKEAYKGEIDRKDKILSSMSVITAPITILFAGVAFLTNSSLDAGQGLTSSDPDIIVAAFYIICLVIVWHVISIIRNFDRLLAGEDYFYLPDAENTLDGIAKNKEYCTANNVFLDGEASRYSKVDTIVQLSEAATKNASSNDKRLSYRQKIFKSTMTAIIGAALGFIAVAVHRERPNIWTVSNLWKGTHGSTSASPQSTTNDSSSTLGSAQTSPSQQQPPATSSAPITPSGH